MKSICTVFLITLFAISACTQDMKVKVYFSNEKIDPEMLDCHTVYPVERSIPATKAVATAALKELFKGVTQEEKNNGYSSVSPDKTKDILKSVKVKDGAAYVNFNKSILKLTFLSASCGSGYVVNMEKTLLQFPTIERVYFAIEGDPEHFYGWIPVGECPEGLEDCSGKEF